jgi:apolipoprotein N-acyltransferase
LAFAAFWMLGEWLRGWVLTGFAWNPVGAAWLEAPAIAQLAGVIGALGLSALVVLAGGGLWLLTMTASRRTGIGLVVIVGAGALVAATLPEPPASNGVPVFLVQPNIGQDVKYAPGAQDAHLRKYHDMTREALAKAAPGRPPAVILWSESSVPYLVEEEPQVRAFLASALGPGDLLLFGGVAANRDAAGNVLSLTNSLYVLDSGGALLGRYDKAHLVPLGEYVPARALMTALGVARLAPGDVDFLPGPGPKTLALPGFPAVGVQICYEIIFPGRVVDATNRPGWIATISNDAWFGPSGPPQHLAQARLRAIEEGLPIARTTPTGISAMIDAHGRVVDKIPAGVEGALSAPLPEALPPTLFARFGHQVPGVLGLLLIVLALRLDRRKAVPNI